MRRLIAGGLAWIAGLMVTPAWAQNDVTLAGTWNASSLRSAWNIGDWGSACGPRPTAGDEAGGQVTITHIGSELQIVGLGRQYSTAQCWERYPGLSRVSHSAGGRSWRTVCKTAATDPRQATLATTLTGTDTTLHFDETGQYQFVIKGQNCTASVRRTRTFRLVQRAGEPAPPPSAPPAAASAPATPQNRCENPGAPVRLEVRPSRKLLRPGEAFQFRAAVLDDKGCTAPRGVSWRVAQADTPVTIGPGGKVEVNEGAAPGNYEIVAGSEGHSVRVTVEVVSNERYEALLSSGRFDAQGETEDAAVTTISRGTVAAGAGVTRNRSESRRTLFVAIVGGAALLIGVIGLVWSIRSRRRRGQSKPGELGAPETAAGAASIRAMVCPTCRQEYAADAMFCPNDGNRLRPAQETFEAKAGDGGVCPVCGQGFDPGVSVCPKHDEELIPTAAYRTLHARATTPTQKVCPICGAQYPGESSFCGSDGAALVPMN